MIFAQWFTKDGIALKNFLFSIFFSVFEESYHQAHLTMAGDPFLSDPSKKRKRLNKLTSTSTKRNKSTTQTPTPSTARDEEISSDSDSEDENANQISDDNEN